MKKKLFLQGIKWILFLGLLIHPVAYADTMTKEEFNTLLGYLNRYGSVAKNGVDLYNAGVACHEQKLTSFVHLDKKDLILLFYNDSLNNCIFATIFTGTMTDTTSPTERCVMSDTIYDKLFTSWNLDAIKAADRNATKNPVLNNFLHTLQECLKPSTIEKLLSDLQFSPQSNGGQQ